MPSMKPPHLVLPLPDSDRRIAPIGAPVPALRRHFRNAVAAFLQDVPESIHIRCARELAAHADDGDKIVFRLFYGRCSRSRFGKGAADRRLRHRFRLKDRLVLFRFNRQIRAQGCGHGPGFFLAQMTGQAIEGGVLEEQGRGQVQVEAVVQPVGELGEADGIETVFGEFHIRIEIVGRDLELGAGLVDKACQHETAQIGGWRGYRLGRPSGGGPIRHNVLFP
jgi:hypothetical protein